MVQKQRLMSEITHILSVFMEIVLLLKAYSPLVLMVLQPDWSPNRSH